MGQVPGTYEEGNEVSNLCPTCSGREYQTYEVTCIKCDNLKWPRLLERPKAYVCALCRMGGGRKQPRSPAQKASLAKARLAQGSRSLKGV